VHGEPPHTPYPPMHPYHAVILSTSGETQTLEARGGSVTPGADASQRAARHFAGVKGARTAIYLATQEPTRCYISPSSAMDSAASRSTADDSRCLHAASSRWVEGDTGAGLMAATGFGEGEGDEWVSSTCDCTHAGMSGPCIGDKAEGPRALSRLARGGGRVGAGSEKADDAPPLSTSRDIPP
jgi:hypothetical protein